MARGKMKIGTRLEGREYELQNGESLHIGDTVVHPKGMIYEITPWGVAKYVTDGTVIKLDEMCWNEFSLKASWMENYPKAVKKHAPKKKAKPAKKAKVKKAVPKKEEVIKAAMKDKNLEEKLLKSIFGLTPKEEETISMIMYQFDDMSPAAKDVLVSRIFDICKPKYIFNNLKARGFKGTLTRTEKYEL